MKEVFKNQRGVVLLELLIAFGMFAITVSAIMVLIFASQAISVTTEHVSDAAQYLAADLSDINNLISTTTHDSIYTRTSNLQNENICLSLVTDSISWKVPYINTSSIVSMVASSAYARAQNGDCGGYLGRADWANPQTAINPLTASGTEATSLDILGGLLFVGTQSSVTSTPDIWVFDVRDKLRPLLKSSLDISGGVMAVDVAKFSDGHIYIFAAIKNSSNQLVVLKVPQDASSPIIQVAAMSLPGVSGSAPGGVCIYYYAGRVYVGTKRTIGNELHVYDVANPNNPVWLGSRQMNHNVNGIMVKDTNAYLATSGNTKDIIVVDVSNPAALREIASIDLPGNEDGKSLYVLGNRLYLGRFASTNPAHPEFNVLDISNLSSGIRMLGSLYLHAAVNSIRVSDKYVFLATTDANKEIQILDIANLSAIRTANIINLPKEATGLDDEENFFYAALKDTTLFTVAY